MRPFHKRFFRTPARRPSAPAGELVRSNVASPLTIVRYKPRRRTKWFGKLADLLAKAWDRTPGTLHLKAPAKLPEPKIEKLRAGYAARLVG